MNSFLLDSGADMLTQVVKMSIAVTDDWLF